MKNICFLLVVLVFTACVKQQQVSSKMLKISFEEKNEVNFPMNVTCQFIPLEANEKSMLGGISQVEIINDRIFVLDEQYQKKMLVFNLEGKYIGQVGGVGNGPGEYITPLKFHIDSLLSVLTIVDREGSCLINYNLNNYKYLSTQKTIDFTDCAWLNDGNIAWFALSGFDTGKRDFNTIMITDSQLEEKARYNQASFISHYGLSLGSVFHQIGKSTLMHHPFSPVIEEVTSIGTRPIYELSFSNQKFPSFDYLREESEGQANYTKTLLSSDYINSYYAYESSIYLFIVYLIKNSWNVGLYNKQTKKAHQYTVFDFIAAADIDGFTGIVGVHDGFFITSIYPESLKKHFVKRDNLRAISKNLSEDDNPILCLFNIE